MSKYEEVVHHIKWTLGMSKETVELLEDYADLLAEQEKAEVVAWIYTNKDTGAEVITRQPPDRITPAYLVLYGVRPLYAHPPAPQGE